MHTLWRWVVWGAFSGINLFNIEFSNPVSKIEKNDKTPFLSRLISEE